MKKLLLILPLLALCVAATTFRDVTYKNRPFMGVDSSQSSSPSMAPDPLHWFRASHLTDVGFTNGQPVTGWTNEGATAVNLNQVTDATGIFLSNNITAINGKSAVYLNGTRYMISHDTAGQYTAWTAQPTTHLYVLKSAGTGNDHIMFATYYNVVNGYQLVTHKNTDQTTIWGGVNELAADLDPNLNAQYYLISAVFNGANSYIRTNGVLAATGAAGDKAVGDPLLGASMSGYGGNLWSGWVAEILVYDYHLSTNDLQDTENYLMDKYGL